jgi:TonB family protein
MFSLLLPLLTIPVFAPDPVALPEVTVTPYRNLLETVIVSTQYLTGNVESFVISSKLLVNLWFAGVLMMVLLFISRIFQIIRIIRNGAVIPENGYKLVLTDKETSPFSFLYYLFVPNNHIQIMGYGRMVSHELEHIRQGHTFDILLLDILLIFQWFNPFIWLLKRAVRENHEYLVDRAVLESGVNTDEYKLLLLSQVAGNQIYAANHFNYSLLKNRFKMMTRIPSPKKAGIKIISGVLIALVLVVIFACEQKKSSVANVKASDSLNIRYADDALLISGKTIEIQKILELLQSRKYDVVQTSNPDNNKTSIILKRSEDPKIDRDSVNIREKSTSPDDSQVFTTVEEMPEFPGGMKALQEFIVKTVKYPENAIKNTIQGKVIVTFVVSSDGSVKNARILRGVHAELDKEAIRVVNSLPKWIPGKQKGKTVNVAFTLPISFALQ